MSKMLCMHQPHAKLHIHSTVMAFNYHTSYRLDKTMNQIYSYISQVVIKWKTAGLEIKVEKMLEMKVKSLKK